jgi:hypothetical protein
MRWPRKGEVDRVLELGVGGEEGGKSFGLVFGAEEVPVLIEAGVGEAGVDVEDRDEVELVGQADDVPEEAAVGGVGGERAVLVGADEGIGELPKNWL